VLAEKIRAAVGHYSYPAVDKVTISAGVAELSGKDSGATLITRADEALYVAKKGGRDRVDSCRTAYKDTQLRLRRLSMLILLPFKTFAPRIFRCFSSMRALFALLQFKLPVSRALIGISDAI